MLVLGGVPDQVDVERASLNWAMRVAGLDEEYFLAFEISRGEFRIVHRRPVETVTRDYRFAEGWFPADGGSAQARL